MFVYNNNNNLVFFEGGSYYTPRGWRPKSSACWEPWPEQDKRPIDAITCGLEAFLLRRQCPLGLRAARVRHSRRQQALLTTWQLRTLSASLLSCLPLSPSRHGGEFQSDVLLSGRAVAGPSQNYGNVSDTIRISSSSSVARAQTHNHNKKKQKQSKTQARQPPHPLWNHGGCCSSRGGNNAELRHWKLQPPKRHIADCASSDASLELTLYFTWRPLAVRRAEEAGQRVSRGRWGKQTEVRRVFVSVVAVGRRKKKQIIGENKNRNKIHTTEYKNYTRKKIIPVKSVNQTETTTFQCCIDLSKSRVSWWGKWRLVACCYSFVFLFCYFGFSQYVLRCVFIVTK